MSIDMKVAADQTKECTVCRGPDASPILDHEGHHAVHEACLQAWSATQTQANRPTTCPSCRVEITSVKGQALQASQTVSQVASQYIDTSMPRGLRIHV